MKKQQFLYQKVSVLLLCLLIFDAGCSTQADVKTPAVTGEPISYVEPSFTDEPEFPGDFAVSEKTASSEASSHDNIPEDPAMLSSYPPAVPGLHTLENFLRTCLLPVGRTMYVWGGGWNEEDTGAGTEARTIGLSENWKTFADLQDSDYDYKNTRYQIHDGLDCSSYVGWVVYNTMENKNMKDGYVLKSTETAESYASYGWGDYLPSGQAGRLKPGDIMSMKGHVWICLGTCSDESVLLVHSSPPGVRICGTSSGDTASQAVLLAEGLMKTYYPEWYSRYPQCSVSTSYTENSSCMRWSTDIFPDAETFQTMSAEELADVLWSPQ